LRAAGGDFRRAAFGAGFGPGFGAAFGAAAGGARRAALAGRRGVFDFAVFLVFFEGAMACLRERCAGPEEGI
jgi:hypothetical protein